MSDIMRAAKLLDPLNAEPEPSGRKFAEALCEIEDTIRGQPGDPGPAYDLQTRVSQTIDYLKNEITYYRRRR